jgi:hypothetical protein
MIVNQNKNKISWIVCLVLASLLTFASLGMIAKHSARHEGHDIGTTSAFETNDTATSDKTELTFAQQRRQRGGQQRGGQQRGGGGRRRQRDEPDRTEYPVWEHEKSFDSDVFTFVRIQYDSTGYANSRRTWANDYPDCDWNFSVRLHELTSMKVDPNGKVLRLTDPELFQYPFTFMSNMANMRLSDAESDALRRYLLKGGFLMADDFWAPRSWRHIKNEMKRVFPNREPRELTADHEIFHIVYELEGTPQVPSIFAWQQGDMFEYWHGDPEGDEDPHFWGYFDDDDRLMALFCHNNDIADGWEREGENPIYFRDFSERVSFPLGINIVTYVMTH